MHNNHRCRIGALVLAAFLFLAGARAQDSNPTSRPSESINESGWVDVTASPFNADPSGKSDSTAAIRQAMQTAKERRLAIYFPSGDYLVSDTLEYSARRKAGVQEGNPCFMIGSRKNVNRPKIILAAKAPGFQDPKAPKPVVYLWTPSQTNPSEAQPNISMNQVIINLDIEIRAGNPGAIGIHHDGAQGSGIEDVTIHAGDGYAGIVGLQAGGGGTHHVTVIGGRYGLDASRSKAAGATVSGATFIGQKECAIRHGGLETLSLVGIKILAPKGNTGPLIRGEGRGPNSGTMTLVDSQIEFETPDPKNVAVESNRSVYLNNAWVRNATAVVKTTDGGALEGSPDGWRQIVEFAHGVMPPPVTAKDWTAQIEPVSYVDGVRQTADVVLLGEKGIEPPEDLQSRHVWESPFGWDSPGIVNVKSAPYNVKGDGKTDDTAALQKAIDENDKIFLPKGTYNISKTIRLRANTQIIGLRLLSAIRGVRSEGGDFNDPENLKPMILSADSAEGDATLAYLSIGVQGDVPATIIHWRTGRNSVFRSIHIQVGREYKLRPTLISDHGGGRWYSIFKAARSAIQGTSEPLRFYQANPEWGGDRPYMDFQKARNVFIYGLKVEGQRAITISDCDNVNVFGYGGNANALAGESLFVVERTPNLRLAGLFDRVNQQGTPPSKWWMVTETPASGNPIKTQPLERLVLYKRGFEQ